jgi:phenol 2-monooxygenase
VRKVTLHQGAIEQIFLDELEKMGVTVQRSTVPTAVNISKDPAVLADPQAYANQVRLLWRAPAPYRIYYHQITLAHIDEKGAIIPGTEEVVEAKFAIGTDGAHSWTRKALGITLDGDNTGLLP